MNTRFLSGFLELQDSVFFQGDARLSVGIQPIGRRPVNIGIQGNPFNAAYANSFINNCGPLQVNRVIPELPIKVDTTSRIAKVGLLYDNTLQINTNGQPGVKSQITTPSGEFTFDSPLFFGSTNSNVSLLYETEDFKIKDSKLTLVPDLWKPRGALKISGSIADALGVLAGLTDFSDITLPDEPVHLKILSLKTSEDFIQTNGQLEIRPQSPGCIPWYKESNGGFGVNTNFQFDGATTLSVRFVKIENSFQLQDNFAAPVGYVTQAYQSSENTAIDISAPSNGRRIVSIRTDNETIRIDSATNKLTSALSFQDPLSITNGQVSLNVDNSTLILSGKTLKGNYQAGRGIKITGNTITSDEELDLTFNFPLVKLGTNVRLDLTGESPVNINDLTGKVSLATDSTLQVISGKLSVIPKQLNGGDGILIADDQISFLGDLHHFDFVDGQAKLRLKDGGGLQSDMEGVFLNLKGEDGILFDGETVRLLFDLKEFKLSSEGELHINLSDTFTTSSTEGLDIKVDNLTIKKDASGLKGGYQAKANSAISVMGNEIGENITCSNGVRRTGNVIEGSYTGTGLIYVTSGSIRIREEDLDQRIKDKTGISQPDSGGGGGGNSLSDLSKGLSNLGSIAGGAGAGAIFGGISGGLSGGAIGSSTGLTSSGITSGIAAGVSLEGAAVSIGSTLSHGFGYGSQGISAGNLEDNAAGWGFSLGNATLLYPDVYTDKSKSVCGIGYLKGSSNSTVIDSESPNTGTLCVLGGVGITKNLHVGESVYAKGFSCRQGVNANFFGNMFNLYWTAPDVEMWIDSSHVGDLAFKQWVQGNFKPLNYEPSLTSYYTRSEVDTIASTLASKTTVFTKSEADLRYKPIDYQPELSGYYSRDEVNTITSTLAPLDFVFTKAAATQRFKPVSAVRVATRN